MDLTSVPASVGGVRLWRGWGGKARICSWIIGDKAGGSQFDTSKNEDHEALGVGQRRTRLGGLGGEAQCYRLAASLKLTPRVHVAFMMLYVGY